MGYVFPSFDIASRRFPFFFFSGLRFPHGVRPRQLFCWRRPRWFSTSSDLWLFSLTSASTSDCTRVPRCRLLDYFLTVLGWLRLQFDLWTTIFNGFRMASTTDSTSGLRL